MAAWSILRQKKWHTEVVIAAAPELQFKRFRWSRKLIENGGSNDINKSSKLEPWASKVDLFEILLDLGKLVF